MTVGFCAPLPPQPTGVADYAARLLEMLRRLGRVEVNPRRADVFLYHLGNNQLHRQIYLQALRRPGVVVLHDAVLHHFFLGALDREAYVAEFVYNYGEWTRDLAGELWARRSRSAQDPEYFRRPMLRRIAEVSPAVLVHNPAAARMVREHYPEARVIEIPFPVWPPGLPPGWEVARWRQAAGLGARAVLFGVFGHLRESKRLATVLRAFQRARKAGAQAALLVAGRFGSEEFQRAVTPLMEGVLRAGYLPEREFWKVAAATDVCLNLRYPASGETSGLGMGMMGIGKAVVFTADEETSRFPEDVCLRVEPGLGEQEMLVEYILWLSGFPEAAREFGRRAATYIRRHHDPEQVAQRYWQALRSV